MPVSVGSKPPKKPKGKWLPLGLGLPFFAFMMWSAYQPEEPPQSEPLHEVVGRQGQVFFAVMPYVERESRQAFEAAAQDICGSRDVCIVHFWLNEGVAATSLPMTDVQANATHSVYNSSLNDFVCHPFADSGQRCAGVD